jgi:hypothetical protein
VQCKFDILSSAYFFKYFSGVLPTLGGGNQAESESDQYDHQKTGSYDRPIFRQGKTMLHACWFWQKGNMKAMFDASPIMLATTF